MVRHRCTRCKEDVGEYGIRHKYAGGLFCEPCLRELRQGRRIVSTGGFFGGFFSRLWSRLTGLLSIPFRPRAKTVSFDAATKVAYKTMKAKARDIPPDPRGASPQKM